MKKLLLPLLLLCAGAASAQNTVASNPPGTPAVIDMESTNKGLLIPRMTETQRNGIPTPRPVGLMIYQTDATPGFYYWNGSTWTSVAGVSTNIYNSDGTLTGQRTVDLNGNDLIFDGGTIRMNETFTIQTTAAAPTLSITTTAGGIGLLPANVDGMAYYEIDGLEHHIFGGNVAPDENGTRSCGLSAHRWSVVYAQNGTIQTSDLRLKKNVESLHYGLPEIIKLQPITYDWKNNSNKMKKIGFSAQELQSIMPELVTVGDDADKTLGVNYGDITPVLVNAVKELQAEIDTLKAQNAKLSAEAARVESLNASYADLADQVKALQAKLSADVAKK